MTEKRKGETSGKVRLAERKGKPSTALKMSKSIK